MTYPLRPRPRDDALAPEPGMVVTCCDGSVLRVEELADDGMVIRERRPGGQWSPTRGTLSRDEWRGLRPQVVAS